MFKKARIKLTLWYLGIIMAISLSFSAVIYIGVNRELTRIENFQRTRIQGILRGFPVSIDIPQAPDADAINESRIRIILILGLINTSILIFSGVGGYFLAGVTLDPISEMVENQKDFVSNASHELRTPLTSLMTEIEVALRDKNMTLAAAKKLLASNLEDVVKMNNLSNYLLTLNRLGEKDVKPEFKKVDLKDVAQKAIAKVNPLTKAPKIKISQRLQSSKIMGNEDSLIELTTILLDNAIKYSGKGKEIVIKTGPNRKLSVQDFGVGIRSKDIPHIFDRFYRADFSRSKEQYDGYGLGLSIAKSIVDQHNAKIKVESKISKGSTFTVSF